MVTIMLQGKPSDWTKSFKQLLGTHMGFIFNTFISWVLMSTSTYLHLHLFYKCRIMANNVANEMEVYESLLSKLIIDMLQNSNKDPKKPKIRKMYYLIKA